MVKLGTTIIAVGLYLVLCGVNLAVNRPRIEKDLTTRTEAALAQEQLPVRKVAFVGRDGQITTQGASADQRIHIVKTAMRVWGVRVANIIALPERSPAMRVMDVGGKVTLYGLLPKGPSQAKLIAAAGVIFGAANVHSEFQIADDVATPGYLDRLSSTLSLLAAVGDGGQLDLQERDLTLTGKVADETARATIEGTARELVPSELHFLNQVTVIPRQTAAAPTPVTPTPNPTPVATPIATPKPKQHTDVVIPKEAFPAPEPAPKHLRAHRKPSSNPLAGQRLHFYFDSVKMVPDSLPRMPEIVELLKQYSGKKIRIIGFADSTGPRKYNVRLSRRRARAVMQALIENGLSAGTFVTEGHGASEFIGDNSTAEGRAMNRRVEFLVLAG